MNKASLTNKIQIDSEQGLISCSTYVPSPNWNERPTGTTISLLVIHGISLPPGQFGGQWVHALFRNELPFDGHPYFKEIADLKVSSHLYINREGQIWQFVPFHKRAWHAGPSCFDNRENCNDFSVGIELEGTDDIPYTSQQYDTLVNVTLALLKNYPEITLDRIVGHSDIAPDRKTDPGLSFDWQKYKQAVASLLESKQSN